MYFYLYSYLYLYQYLYPYLHLYQNLCKCHIDGILKTKCEILARLRAVQVAWRLLIHVFVCVSVCRYINEGDPEEDDVDLVEHRVGEAGCLTLLRSLQPGSLHCLLVQMLNNSNALSTT